jgi:hypothetical protein
LKIAIDVDQSGEYHIELTRLIARTYYEMYLLDPKDDTFESQSSNLNSALAYAK